ncbi:MAG: class I SAM-dependent methyltransferase [Krumholzibacteria bacterium]|nr:class I SAM-dependent methyltransferase [Candidatus Krumholzibacteria bacterium]
MAEPWFTTAFGAHYRALYAHRDAEEARRCLALLRGAGALLPPVLDLGCGDGRHLQALTAADGPLGLDLSAPLLAEARKRVPGARLLRGDMRSLPLRDASLGTVLSLFTAFGYFADDAENARPAAEAGRVLRPGGHWCLDLFDGDRVRAELGDGRPRPRDRSSGPLAVREVRRFDAATATVGKQVEVRPAPGQAAEAAALGISGDGLAYREMVRVYTLPEVDDLAAGAGFRRVAAWGGYAGEPLGGGSRWLLVYRRGAVQEPA